MKSNTTKVCFLADIHHLLDDRVYWKEALSLKKSGYDVHYILAGNKYEKGITEEGINFIKIKRRVYVRNRFLNYFINKIFSGGLYSKMFKQAAGIKADVYHFHDLRVNKIGKKLKSLYHKPVVIYDVHEPHPENILDYLNTKGIFTFIKKIYAEYIRRWEIKCAKNYDFIITTEENLRDRFREKIPSDKVDIIYNYTNLENTRENTDYRDKIYDAIYCGGVTKLRGAFKILEAVKIATREKNNLKVLFLGSYFPENLKSEMQEFIKQNNLGENVILHDSVPYTRVSEFYNKSKIGLGIFLPIKTHRIILQIKIFEYMNYGLPIVGSNFGHINDYIKKENVGIAVNPEEPKEIAGAILKILDNYELFRKYSDNGIAAVDKKYRWDFMEKKLINIYSKNIGFKGK